jgi:hypothetical protein
MPEPGAVIAELIPCLFVALQFDKVHFFAPKTKGRFRVPGFSQLIYYTFLPC